VTSTPVATLPPSQPAAAPAGPPAPGLRERLLGTRPGSRFWGWAAPLAVAVLGGLMRFHELGRPPKLVFDEVYYVKQGASFLRYGYEQSVSPLPSSPAPDPWNLGTTDVFATNADFVVHPPVGKWMIAAGQQLFGADSPVGWRFAVAVCGTLSILMLGRIARRLLGSTLLGTVAALLLAVDGQHFVHSRTSVLDMFVMFWALAGFGCLLIDRDRARARLARHLDGRPGGAPPGRVGPWLGLRWWRLAAAVCLGLACGVKWSGLYFLAAFMLASVLWDVAARRAAGVRHWFLAGTVVDGAQAAFTVLPLAAATYLATWAGWLSTSGGYLRNWASGTLAAPGVAASAGVPASPGLGWVPDAVRSLWHYHAEMLRFHVNLTSSHPYQSNPWSWTVLGRPTAFFYESVPAGTAGCGPAECAQAVTALGNPVVWWGGTLAVAVLLFCWLLGRDWRAGAVLAGVAAGWVPWFVFQERTIYTFYAVAFVPWMVLSLTYVLGLMIGPRDAPAHRRLRGAALAGSIVVLAVLAFAFFHPVLSGEVVPRTQWADRMWLPSWI
jgi:dolichyl-phosphate-mannose--protein O-mannosyl transferase